MSVYFEGLTPPFFARKRYFLGMFPAHIICDATGRQVCEELSIEDTKTMLKILNGPFKKAEVKKEKKAKKAKKAEANIDFSTPPPPPPPPPDRIVREGNDRTSKKKS